MSTRFVQYRPGCKPCQIPLQEGNAVYDKGRCGFTLRVEAGRCGSMRFEPGQNGYQYGIEIRAKILNMTKNFSTPYLAPGIHQELTRVTMRVYTGGTGSIRFSFLMDPVRNPAVCDCSINIISFPAQITADCGTTCSLHC